MVNDRWPASVTLVIRFFGPPGSSPGGVSSRVKVRVLPLRSTTAGEPVGVVVEGDLVGAGQRPPPFGGVSGDRPQVEVDPGWFGEPGDPVAAGDPVAEPVGGAVAVGDHHVLVGLAADDVGLVGVDVDGGAQPGQPGDGQRPVVAGRRVGVVLQRVVGQVDHGGQAAAGVEERGVTQQHVPVGHVGQGGHARADVFPLVLVIPFQAERALQGAAHGRHLRWSPRPRSPAHGAVWVCVDDQAETVNRRIDGALNDWS
jgi:hypothetical protein